MDENKTIYNFLKMDEVLPIETLPIEKTKHTSRIKDICVRLFSLVLIIAAHIIGLRFYLNLFAGGLLDEIWWGFAYVLVNGAVLVISVNLIYSGFELIAPVICTVISVILSSGCLYMLDEFHFFRDLYKDGSNIFIGLLFFFSLIQAVIWVVTYSIPLFVFGIISNKKKKEAFNREILERKINDKKQKLKFYEDVINIKDNRILHYINKSITLYNQEFYEDAIAAVRKTLECYLYDILEHYNVMFREEREIQIYNIIQYLESKKSKWDYGTESMHEIRKTCNSSIHVSGDRSDATKEKTEELIISMMRECRPLYDTDIYDGEEVRKNLEEKMYVYLERAKKYISMNDYEDALLNLRKSLECVVHGYLKLHHMICTYGHEDNMSGYIDALFDKNYIGQHSKQNMHKIRDIGNKSVHMKEITSVQNTMNKVMALMEEEIKVYESHKRSIDEEFEYVEIDDDIKKEISVSEYEEDEVEQEDIEQEDSGYYKNDEVYVEYNDNANNRQYEEEERMPSELNDPEKYWDPTRRNDPIVQTDPEEYWNTGINF